MNDLSISDGFRFGCGFMLAALIAWLAMLIVGGILTAVFGAALGPIFQRFGSLGLIPQILGLL